MIKNVRDFAVDAGGWGLTSVLAAFVSLGISVWDHLHDKPVSSIVFFCLTVPLFWIGPYVAYIKKQRELEAEKQKNASPPDIGIELPRLIARGRVGSVTDLFLNVVLKLRNPREVSLSGFELIGVRNGVENAAKAVDDVIQWERLLRDELTIYEHLPLRALPKELTQRGNPVEGWLHFVIDSSESDLYDSTLWLKAHSAHGTCLGEIAGRRAFPNKETGAVRKIGSYSHL